VGLIDHDSFQFCYGGICLADLRVRSMLMAFSPLINPRHPTLNTKIKRSVPSRQVCHGSSQVKQINLLYEKENRVLLSYSF
jgi:hypothetical protein